MRRASRRLRARGFSQMMPFSGAPALTASAICSAISRRTKFGAKIATTSTSAAICPMLSKTRPSPKPVSRTQVANRSTGSFETNPTTSAPRTC